MPAVVAAEVKRFSIAFSVEGRGFVHVHATDWVFRVDRGCGHLSFTLSQRLFLACSHSAHQSQMLFVRENLGCLADCLNEIHSFIGSQLLDLGDFGLDFRVVRLIGSG